MNKEEKYYEKVINIFAHMSVPWQQDILTDFFELIKIDVNCKVLDVGTGIGNNIRTIRNYSNEITVTDVSQNVLDIFNENNNKEFKIKTIVAGLDQLLLPSNLFDVVICTEVIEHANNFNQGVKECLRVLKPGGYFIISSPNYLNLAGVVKVLWEFLNPGKSWDAWGNHENGRENMLNSLKLRQLILDNDVKIVRSRGGDFLRSWLPFLKKYYTFVDKHPALWLGENVLAKYFLMNFFILGQKN